MHLTVGCSTYLVVIHILIVYSNLHSQDNLNICDDSLDSNYIGQRMNQMVSKHQIPTTTKLALKILANC